MLESLQEAALEKLAGRNPARSCRISNGAMQGAGLPLGDDGEGDGYDPLAEARRLLSAWLTTDSPRDLLSGLHEEVDWRRGDNLRGDSMPANALLQVSKSASQ